MTRGGTNITFSFNTAVTTATEGIDGLHTAVQSHHRVMIGRVMGRNPGWIALYTGVTMGGHYPFSIQMLVLLTPNHPAHSQLSNIRI